MIAPSHPLLVVAYSDKTRSALAALLDDIGIPSVQCTNFCEAENLALKGPYSGMLVDLSSIIKSKGEEKIVAYTLANFFPTLRVRTQGGMVVPMATGSVTQDKSLDDFLHITCVEQSARRLREFKRHPVCLATLLMYNNLELRGFTLDVSWGGMFIVDLQAERFSVEDQVTIFLPEFGCHIPAEVRRIKQWGVKRHAPGIGLRFTGLDETIESIISGITRSRKGFDRDRLAG